jgi:hypothetical protein
LRSFTFLKYFDTSRNECSKNTSSLWAENSGNYPLFSGLGATAIARGGENNLPDILLLLEHPSLIPSVLAEMLSLLNLILTNFQHDSERSLVAFFNIGKLILS